MSNQIDPGMYPLSGVIGDKRTLDLLDPYEYVNSQPEIGLLLIA